MERIDEDPTTPPPRSSLLGVRACLVLGIGTLLPFSAVITSVDFFTARYPQYPNPDLWITCLFLLPAFIIITAQLAWGSTVPLEWRFRVGYITCASALLAIVVFSCAEGSFGWYGIMAAIFAAGIGEGFAEGALYPFAETLSVAHVRAAQLGQALSGVIVCLLRVATRLVFLNDPLDGVRLSSYLYYTVAAMGCLFCVFTLQRFLQSPEAAAKSQELVNNTSEKKIDFSVLKRVVPRIRVALFALFLNYASTLLVYPALAVTITATTKGLPQDWYVILVILCYNVTDVAGRVLGAMPRFHVTCQSTLLKMSVVRSGILVPFFLLLGSETIHSDTVTFLVTLTHGITNGFLSVSCFSYPSTVFTTSEEREQSANAMLWALMSGILTGVYLAIPVTLSVIARR